MAVHMESEVCTIIKNALIKISSLAQILHFQECTHKMFTEDLLVTLNARTPKGLGKS